MRAWRCGAEDIKPGDRQWKKTFKSLHKRAAAVHDLLTTLAMAGRNPSNSLLYKHGGGEEEMHYPLTFFVTYGDAKTKMEELRGLYGFDVGSMKQHTVPNFHLFGSTTGC